MKADTTNDWVDLRLHAETGIETIRAHFEGHAYDPHWHDSYLLGVTEQGVQQFHCDRRLNTSVPGRAFLLEPGEIHDGNAPATGGFTYRMLYLQPHSLMDSLARLGYYIPNDTQPFFARTLSADPVLARSVHAAIGALHGNQPLRLLRDTLLDDLLHAMATHIGWRYVDHTETSPGAAQRAREFLHAHAEQDMNLDTLAAAAGVSRFRLSRAFKAAYGLPPHAYLIQLRLTQARQRLAAGETPAAVATTLGFADQSHLGRWFQRAYRLSPAAYRRRCTNLPDAS